MTPEHRRTIENALLAVQHRRREMEAALFDAQHVSPVYPVEELWDTRLAENLVTIAEFTENGSHGAGIAAALQQVFHLLYSNPLNPEEYLLPDDFQASELGVLLLEAQVCLISSLLSDQEEMVVLQSGPDGAGAALAYSVDVSQSAYSYVDLAGVGSCLLPFAQLVLAMQRRRIDRVLARDVHFLFFGTAQLWMELFIFVAKRRQILVVDARNTTAYDLREAGQEAMFRRIGESTQA